MTDWKKVRLGEILTESKVEAENSGSETRLRVLLNAKGVIQRPITKETAGATKYFARKSEQFIYGKQNLHKGAFGIIPEKLNGFTSSSDLPAFDVSSDCLPEWIVYFLRQGDFYLSLIDIAKGAATKRIQPKALFEVEIPLPEIKVQREIIREFKRREETQYVLLNEIQTQKSLLTQLKQAILQEAIQGKLTREWRAQNPKKITGENSATALLENIKAEKAQLVKEKKIKKEKPLPPITEDEIPFELPSGWVWCRLGDVSTYLNGKGFESSDFQKNDGIKCIKITNAGVGKIIPTDDTLPLKFKESYKNYLVYESDIVIALTRPYIAEGLKVSLCPKSYNESLLNQRVAVLRGYLVQNKYIYKYLRSDYVLNFYRKEFDAKGQQPNLKTDHITNLIFPLPPLAEQKAIVAKVEALMEKCTALEQEIIQSEQHAQMLMQAVLKEAFEGEESKEEMPVI